MRNIYYVAINILYVIASCLKDEYDFLVKLDVMDQGALEDDSLKKSSLLLLDGNFESVVMKFEDAQIGPKLLTKDLPGFIEKDNCVSIDKTQQNIPQKSFSQGAGHWLELDEKNNTESVTDNSSKINDGSTNPKSERLIGFLQKYLNKYENINVIISSENKKIDERAEYVTLNNDAEILDQSLTEFSPITENYSSENPSGLCEIRDPKKTSNNENNTTTESKEDGINPFPTYWYWDAEPSPIDNNGSGAGFINTGIKYPYDQAVAVLVGTAGKWPDRCKQSRKVTKTDHG